MHLWPISSHCIIHLLIYSAKLHSCLIISSIIYCIKCVFFHRNATDLLAAINLLLGTVTQTMENRLVVFQFTLNGSLSLSLFILCLCPSPLFLCAILQSPLQKNSMCQVPVVITLQGSTIRMACWPRVSEGEFKASVYINQSRTSICMT